MTRPIDEPIDRLHGLRVRDVMSRDVVGVSADTPLYEIAGLDAERSDPDGKQDTAGLGDVLRIPAAAIHEIEHRRILRVGLLEPVGGIERVEGRVVIVVQVVIALPSRVVGRVPTEDARREAWIPAAGRHPVKATIVGEFEGRVADVDP